MDAQHLKTLKRGAKPWNAWRRKNPDVVPDLEGASLVFASLEAANLQGATLTGANLKFAELKKADLRGARLEGANLQDANLQAAKLQDAVLEATNLRGASLAGAKLQGVSFAGAVLWGADFERAALDDAAKDAVLRDATLDGAHVGLPETVETALPDGVVWSRVHVGEPADFAPDHDPEDAAYWLIRQGQETVQEALARRSATSTDDVTVEFARAVWRELHAFEIGLREALGKGRFRVTRADTEDRLAVSFESPEDFELGLETVVLHLAALEAVAPLQLGSMIVRSPAGEVIVLQPREMHPGAVLAQLDQLQAASGEMGEESPLGLFARRLAEALAGGRVRKAAPRGVAPLQLFGRAKERFAVLGPL